MSLFRFRSWPAFVVAVLLLLPSAAALAQSGGEKDSGFDDFFDRALAQGKGLRTDWEGSVSGDFNARIGGRAKLHFVELGNGKLQTQFYLGGGHQYYDGIGIGGVVSCARGTRTYPVWVRRFAGEDQPDGRMNLYFREGNATISRRMGVSPVPDIDMYSSEFGRLTLTLLEDRLAGKIEAVMNAGPIREGSNEVVPRIRVLARFEAERTLENERYFNTSRCEGRAPFEVVSVKPEDGRENVLEEKPEILVELSEDVHPESLENPDLIVVRTLLRSPTLQAGTSEPALQQTPNDLFTPAQAMLGDDEWLDERVPGTLELEDERTIRFVPDVPLRTGVRYQIDIATGDDGIRSKDFHVLEERWPTWFTTRVDPEDVRVHVYQTTRDATLIQRKPAVARVYVEWDENMDIDPGWQVEQAEFDVRLTQEDENRELVPAKAHRVQRPDKYDDDDRRRARDSVNVFGWKPRKEHGTQVVARVRPHDPYPVVREDELPEDTGRRDVEYARLQLDELTVEPVIVRVGSWRSEPPSGQTIGHVMRAFALDNEYARQVFPVVKVRGWPLGFFEPPYGADVLDSLWWQAGYLDDHYGRFSGADIVVGYYPPEITDGRGQGIVTYPDQYSNVVVMPVRETDWSPVPAVVKAPLVAHEYGHIFGLSHVPDVDFEGREVLCKSSLAGYLAPSEGIEGFRILAGGQEGHSKSSTTGNGEDAPSLKQLMFPCQYDGRAMWWISDEYYKRLVKELPGLMRGQRNNREWRRVARTDPRVEHGVKMDRNAPVKPPGVRWMLLSGFTDGAGADFLPAVEVPAPANGPGPDSRYRVVVEADDGRELASRRIRPPAGPGKHYFSAVVEVVGEPARARLLKDGQPIGELADTQAPPAPRVLSHEDGAVLEKDGRLRWRAVPGEGAMLYSVRYHAGPNGPTRVLAALTNRSELPIDPDALPRGDAPVIEVIAHAGLHEARTRLRVQLPDTLRPMLVHPVGEMPASDEAGIGAWFPAELAPDSLVGGGARLLDGGGAEVPARAFVDPNGSGVRILPQAPLAPETEYTVHLAPGLEALDGRVVSSAVRWSFRTAAESAEAAVPDLRQPPLPRAVTPLPPLPGAGGAEAPPAAAERATGEATMIGAGGTQLPVTFSVCESAQNPSARVLLDGRFGDEDSGVRFRLERAAGDTLVLSVERRKEGVPMSARMLGALDQFGGSGLRASELQGHWTVSAMLDFEDGRDPLIMRVDCGLP